MSENGVLTGGAPQSKRGDKSMVLIVIIMAVVAVVGIVLAVAVRPVLPLISVIGLTSTTRGRRLPPPRAST